MRPYSLKRLRNGKFKSKRPRRMRPIKLTKKDKRLVRTAVRAVNRRGQTQVYRYASNGNQGGVPFAITSLGYTTGYRNSFTWIANPLGGLSNQADTYMNDVQIMGTRIFLKSIVVDFLFRNGFGTDGTTVNTFPFWIRMDLIRSPLQLTTGASAGGLRWAANDGGTNNPQTPLWDADSDPTGSISGGDKYMWPGPLTPIDRRHNTRIKTKIIHFRAPLLNATSIGTEPAYANTVTEKRVRFKVPINKVIQFQDRSIGDGPEYLKGENYYIVLSVDFGNANSVPSSYDADFSAFNAYNVVSVFFKNMQ